MLPELGQVALLLALALSIVLATLPLAGAWRGIGPWMALARPLAYGMFALLGISFAILTHAFVVQDFSVAYVANNSNSLLPMIYRFSAVWGAHEGSLLLWVLILAGWTAAVARFSRSLPLPVVARVLAIMGWVSVGFLLFTAITSNPFARMLPAAAEGRDLNPLLQDPGLIIHPPMLYMGYVGFAVAFAFAIAAMLDGKLDRDWVRWSRPWTNVAWAFLTIGIALGSWWAYYELGWGGWWFWDPVENASFLPWLVGAALIHSQAATEKRGSFRGWTLLLAIAAFSLSLLGTFLVRSGVLTSVHAFASSPERGLFILAFLAVIVGGSLLLYALRGPRGDDGAPFELWSRETALLVNNLLLTVSAAMVLLGTLYPLLADALDLGRISVGPPYFGLLFTLLMAPLVLAVPFGPLLRWQREEPSKTLRMLAPWAVLAALAGLLALLTVDEAWWKPLAAAVVGAWLVGGTARFVWTRFEAKGRAFSAEMLGMTLAHAGIGVFVFGVLMTEGRGLERDVALAPGQSVEVRGFEVLLEGVAPVQGPNYTADRATVVVTRGGAPVAVLHPEKRRYASGGQVMTEAAIDPALHRDVYVALGESLGPRPEDGWALRIYIKPFIRLIWLGALLMALGAFVSAADRRLRTPVRRGAAPAMRQPAKAPAAEASA